jgi:phage major head subunit gpT-like protein
MIINQTNIAGLYTALNTIFNGAFEGTPTFYEKVAMVVPSSTRTNDYKFMLQFPMLKEWLGDRQIRSLAAQGFQITNQDFDATVEIDRNDIEDDQLGIYNPVVAELGRAAKQHPDKQVFELMFRGFSTKGYDGAYFFADSHAVGVSQVSNFGGGTGSAWYLFDTTRAIKPFIFQMRSKPQLIRQDRPDDEQVFMRKKYRYGVDYRGAVGYGLWQLAYASKEPLNTANYAAARAAMMSFVNEEGAPLGIMPQLLVVPPNLEAEAREILQAETIIGDPGAGGSKTNIWKGSAELLVSPWLS